MDSANECQCECPHVHVPWLRAPTCPPCSHTFTRAHTQQTQTRLHSTPASSGRAHAPAGGVSQPIPHSGTFTHIRTHTLTQARTPAVGTLGQPGPSHPLGLGGSPRGPGQVGSPPRPPAAPPPPPRPPACNCHGHARDCYYDPEVDRRNASQNQDHVYQGGGVCIDCQVGGAGAAAPAPGMGAWGDGAWGDGARAGGGAAPELTALRPPSITPLASTVSSVCPASTAPRTTPWTRPTPAAVSGVRLSGAAWERHPGCPGAGSVGRGGLGPGQLSGRPGHGSHPPSQVREADTAPPPRPHSPRVT